MGFVKQSGYRMMWMIVMFDLPTLDKTDRKRANRFRLFLKDNGFEMSQLSVYFKFIGQRENSKKVVKLIEKNTPPGKVIILFFTDKQFSEIICIHNNQIERMPEKPEQLMLF